MHFVTHITTLRLRLTARISRAFGRHGSSNFLTSTGSPTLPSSALTSISTSGRTRVN